MPTNNRTISALGSQTQTTPVAKAIEGYIDFSDGITLPNAGSQTAGTASSDVLDWYEEGTWTPAFSSTSPGTFSATYTTQTGTYTRIGNQVTCYFYVELNTYTRGTASGDFSITGLPFSPWSSGINFGGIRQFVNMQWGSYEHMNIGVTGTTIRLRTYNNAYNISGIFAQITSVLQVDNSTPASHTPQIRGGVTYRI